MQIVINIPDEQIKKSLEESKHIHEDEGEKGFVHIAMLYTNAQLEFVDVERKTDFYSCEYNVLPKGHGRLIDESKIDWLIDPDVRWTTENRIKNTSKTVIEADEEEGTE